ncbi:Kynureninase (L-kynurenine hydrolase) [Metarhizium acridum]|uniref:Kynureninase n=1 Tax=Metarhizium acridum (strain CQMa 102) TaxID=655827 RepID=E9E6G7_METAQ|nr:kynureninase, putative [Metarhizium acridum CQMa 102]EFY88413.1 kynureninase, putative [Metarhizium acridum CQMa 102]KAG8418678.1 Kynureninase (L-kynurenine hydrolase) [Metarhizium acridum]KAG8425676.1 Kynureninase (L-kynurenine hydrolase) [Metarhizium acridum]
MDLAAFVDRLRNGSAAKFPADANTLAFAQKLDSQDQLKHLRDEFVLPTKGSLKKRALDGSIPGQAANNGINGTHNTNGAGGQSADADKPCLYFVGNSLGAQPRAVRDYLNAQLETWASIGVNGHFTDMDNSPLRQWQDMAEDCAKKSSDLVGASPHEIVIMNTLTVNLHVMMASFYKPTAKRHKVILEWKPFPSDHYAIESQVVWHGRDPDKSMVKIEPDENSLIPTEKILRTIDEHAQETALLLLPGIQYYSGQLFDMARITAYAKERGIVVGWDLAHAAGNVELRLHDWDVDFACWCTYKYINAGPGSIAGAYVHERHGQVEWAGGSGRPSYRPRLAGWYGGDKSVRFNMDNTFVPTPGAAGYQLSNPSAIDLAALSGALSVFNKTCMRDLRSKALVLTAYAELLLDQMLEETKGDAAPIFTVLTPRDPLQRGTQLSVLLRDGLLEKVSQALEENGAICDKRKPNVIRVAPVPLYTRFEDVWAYMQVLRGALGL